MIFFRHLRKKLIVSPTRRVCLRSQPLPCLTCCGKPGVSNKIAKVFGISDASIHLFKKLLRWLMIHETSRKLSSISGYWETICCFEGSLHKYVEFLRFWGKPSTLLRSSDLFVARSLLEDVYFYQILSRFFWFQKILLDARWTVIQTSFHERESMHSSDIHNAHR